MPFTFSHPAIVLPLSYLPKKWISLSGLVIGSLTPDFEYFLRMRVKSNFSHTVDGLFWFDLPLGIFLAFIFHNIVRDTFIHHLPIWLKSRFLVGKSFDWNQYFKRNWLAVIVSILIGAASHIFWDGFTHEHGYFVQIIPELQRSIDLFGRQVPVFKLTQHSSTLLGGLIIVFAISKLPASKIDEKESTTKYWLIFAGLTVTIVAIRLLSGLELKQYGNVIVTTISAGMLSLVLTPLIMSQGKVKAE